MRYRLSTVLLFAVYSAVRTESDERQVHMIEGNCKGYEECSLLEEMEVPSVIFLDIDSLETFETKSYFRNKFQINGADYLLRNIVSGDNFMWYLAFAEIDGDGSAIDMYNEAVDMVEDEGIEEITETNYQPEESGFNSEEKVEFIGGSSTDLSAFLESYVKGPDSPLSSKEEIPVQNKRKPSSTTENKPTNKKQMLKKPRARPNNVHHLIQKVAAGYDESCHPICREATAVLLPHLLSCQVAYQCIGEGSYSEISSSNNTMFIYSYGSMRLGHYHEGKCQKFLDELKFYVTSDC